MGELTILDPTDPVFNPIWRQGMYSIPIASRLGVVTSIYDWYIGTSNFNSYQLWNFEIVSLAHLCLSGLLALASIWHWAYWDLDLFLEARTGNLVLDLVRILGIHLVLSSIISFFFGISYLSGFSGPELWTSDSVGILGSTRAIKPVYSIVGLTLYCYGVIISNHIIVGFLGFILNFWHVSSRSRLYIYSLCKIKNIETTLSTSITSVLYIIFITSSTMWYGSLTNPLELLGPSRYQWDNGYFSIEIERRVKAEEANMDKIKWEEIPDKIIMYDYIGT